MEPVVYIDGQEGTTGLQIYERLGARRDIFLLRIDPEKRHDVEERKKMINAADLVFLCLPDGAAKEAVTLVENPNTRIIDASTAHRVAPGWNYGFSSCLLPIGRGFSPASELQIPAAMPPVLFPPSILWCRRD